MPQFMTASFYYWRAFPQPKENVFMQSKKIPTRKRDVLRETEGHHICVGKVNNPMCSRGQINYMVPTYW